MSVTKELIEQERQLLQSGRRLDIHLHREGTFLRAYDRSAWLCCRFLHDFKVSKRLFKGIDEPVAYIGFPETSLGKWIPEGAEQRVESEKHLVMTLPELMMTAGPDEQDADYAQWKESVPLTESNPGARKHGGVRESRSDGIDDMGGASTTLTAIMQRVLAWPIESKSPLETVVFVADIKQRLASLV